MLEKDAMNILMKFLDKKAREAEEEVTQKGILSDDKAIPLMLKSQFNHIAHLETMMDERFEQMDIRFQQLKQEMDLRFGQVDSRFNRLEKNIFAGFAFLGFLITFYRFIH